MRIAKIYFAKAMLNMSRCLIGCWIVGLLLFSYRLHPSCTAFSIFRFSRRCSCAFGCVLLRLFFSLALSSCVRCFLTPSSAPRTWTNAFADTMLPSLLSYTLAHIFYYVLPRVDNINSWIFYLKLSCELWPNHIDAHAHTYFGTRYANEC